MSAILGLVIALLPVALFTLALELLDSFRLIKVKSLAFTLLAGCIAAGAAIVINRVCLNLLQIDFSSYSRYFSPLTEEILKAVYPIILLRRRKIGFLTDAAVRGFAVGAGFALVENIYYFHFVQESNVFLWILRGFGTAFMHGGATSVFTMLGAYLSERRKSLKAAVYLPGLALAVVIHSFFNHFFIPPLATTIIQILGMPLTMLGVFAFSERDLKGWLQSGFDSDLDLISHIDTGKIMETSAGRYLENLNNVLSLEMVADMFCYLRLYLELTLRAKGILMMHESGFDTPPERDIKELFDDLQDAEKRIGRTGKRALAPLLRTSPRELWQLYYLADSVGK